MRRQELTQSPAVESKPLVSVRQAAQAVLEVYQHLAADGAHLLDALLDGQSPDVWNHYPSNDARDQISGFQWFYHSHSQDDRPGASEHGHFHIFAGRPALDRSLDNRAERNWRKQLGFAHSRSRTRHLFCIGMNAKGLPNSLFTVNSWVTGDMLASAEGTTALIEGLRLNTGYRQIDQLIEAVAVIYAETLAKLMENRDLRLRNQLGAGIPILNDRRMEVLSETAIDLDQSLPTLF